MSFRSVTVLLCLVMAFGLPAAQAQEYLWCYDSDVITFELDPDTSALSIEHRAAMYNCCPEPVSYEVALTPGIITVTEIVGVETPCDCICCFNLITEVTDIPPGFWTVRFNWLNQEDLQWWTEEFQVVVPGEGEPGIPVLLDWEISDCLDTSAVPDPPDQVRSWDTLKAWYREH